MNKYRKKPVVIEAVQWQGSWDHADTITEWIDSNGGDSAYRAGVIVIATLEGQMRADIGDWVIRGVKGEFYPCKPDIFAATYEPADATTPTPKRQTARGRHPLDADPLPDLGPPLQALQAGRITLGHHHCTRLHCPAHYLRTYKDLEGDRLDYLEEFIRRASLPDLGPPR